MGTMSDWQNQTIVKINNSILSSTDLRYIYSRFFIITTQLYSP